MAAWSRNLMIASVLVVAAPTGASGGLEVAADPSPGWELTPVGEGIKPALALDSNDAPAMVWMLEDFDGYVEFASSTDGWTAQRVAEGYFYGPIDVAFDAEDRPNVVWHDHQDDEFDQAKGDLAFGLLDGGEWLNEAAADDGHDGWDSTVVIGPDGQVWAAGIDPAQFGRTDGVEFYERAADGTWTVTPVGSGPIEYEFNVALAASPEGNPALAWFNHTDADLVYAERIDGDWQLETVASDGDVGRYSSLAFDSQGRPHLSFFEVTEGSTGRVLHAVRDGDGWTIEEVGLLEDVTRGPIGARRNSAIAIGSDDTVHVAFTDRAVVRFASRGADGTWTVDDILTAGDRTLGQLVSMKLDAAGTPHLATYEVTGTAPLDGVILYLTPS